MVCLRDIQGVRVDVLFLSAAGVAGGGAWHPDPTIVAVKQAMLEVAERSYLLVDHTKLGATALHEIVGLTEVDAVVTDAGAPADRLAELHAIGVEVVIAE